MMVARRFPPEPGIYPAGTFFAKIEGKMLCYRMKMWEKMSETRRISGWR